MRIGSGSPCRVIVAVQRPGSCAYTRTAPLVVASNKHVLVSLGLSIEQPGSVVTSYGRWSGGGERLPSVPPGGAGTGSPQRAGTCGGEPPVNHGSSCSRPYQLTISSE